ncbi:MAG TPA: hypothetical protein VFW40_09235, partial [Capsulimonadaceae bacterium]|nr:hypothetical protein [Capsulimonadaceae bacterium]
MKTISPQKPDLAPAPAKSAGKPTLHLAYLDGFRGLAALYVMIGHAFETIMPDPQHEHLSRALKLLDMPFKYGHFAV